MKGLQRLIFGSKLDDVLAKVFAAIKEPMREVEEFLFRAVQSSVQEMTAMAMHLLSAGGKRLRPALTLLCAKFVDRINHRTIAFAAAVELMHTASLIHDDVIDKAELRRGQATVHSLWGNEAAIMCGDFLYAAAFNILSEDGDIDVIRTMTNASSQVCEGEILELQLAFNPFITEAQCLEIARMKTAELMAASCKIGALSTNSNGQIAGALESFGRNLGIAFQIVDDVLDLEGSVEEIGKPVGSDFLEGKITLPIRFALDALPDDKRKFWAQKISNRDISLDDVSDLVSFIKANGILERARKTAQNFSEKALSELRSVEKVFSVSREALSLLEDVAHFIVRRRI